MSLREQIVRAIGEDLEDWDARRIDDIVAFANRFPEIVQNERRVVIGDVTDVSYDDYFLHVSWGSPGGEFYGGTVSMSFGMQRYLMQFTGEEEDLENSF